MISTPYHPMSNSRLDQLIRRIAAVIEGNLGNWRIDYGGRHLFILTDEAHNRMRVMTPVAEESELNDEDRQILLAANFDRALGAKYAVSSGYVWSVFMHPLAELVEDQFIDAVQQVKSLADNYGTTYASSDLKFGGT